MNGKPILYYVGSLVNETLLVREAKLVSIEKSH